MSISEEDARVTPSGPYLPEAPGPWLPAPAAAVVRPSSVRSLDVASPAIARVTTSRPPKRPARRSLLVVLALAATSAGGYFSSMTLNQTGAGESTQSDADEVVPTPVTDIAVITTPDVVANTVLPITAYVRPSYRVATFVETSLQVGYKDGLPVEQNMVITAEVDYVTPVASISFDVQGSSSNMVSQLILTNEYSYQPSTTFGAPWERTTRGPSPVAMDTVGHLRMYQDVVTPAVRDAATDVVVTNDVVHSIPVTTYRFDVPWTKLYDNVADDLTTAALVKDSLLQVHVTLSVDADGLVRVNDHQYDEQAWMDAASVVNDGFDWFVHTRVEVTSTSNEPSTVVPPAEFVDKPAE